MPFDTTYYISTYDPDVSAKVIVKGGDDIFVYLGPWQLPSAVNPAFSGADSLVKSKQELLAKDIESGKKYIPDTSIIIIMISVFVIIFLKVRQNLKYGAADNETDYGNRKRPKPKPYLTYYGDELDFSDAAVRTVLTKRFPYFNSLATPLEQERFLKRLQHFMGEKTFKIHDKKGFKEMPILISAAAIQLSFGLQKYLLPNFEFIHVYPQEFMRINDRICFLEGNVSGHVINLSWKHFLEGYENPTDGKNVGLHEMAHAVYYQTFITEENVDTNFRSCYDGFIADGNKVYDTEKKGEIDLYSAYAETSFQEFWAESVEIFFEKPQEMKTCYPDLYDAMKTLLNQDPGYKRPSVFS